MTDPDTDRTKHRALVRSAVELLNQRSGDTRVRIEELVDVDEHVVLIGALEDLDRRGVTGRPLVLLWVFLAGSVGSVLECRSREHALQLASETRETAEERDATAAERDAAADQRDDEAGLRDRDAELIETAVVGLERAISDRSAAAGDRERSKSDRHMAARDRAEAAEDRGLAAVDELTGTQSRLAGLRDIEREIHRARRTNGQLVAAFVDVEGLEGVNDAQGHAAGDELLIAVAETLKSSLRPYDVVARFGGDEFICALPDIACEQARERFEEMQKILVGRGSISVGFAEFQAADVVDDLVRRADEDRARTRKGS